MWYSARSLARTPGPSLALLLTIALGVGGNASIDSFSRGLTTVDLPLRDADAIVALYALDAQRSAGPLSFDDYLSLTTPDVPFVQLGAVRESQKNVTLFEHTVPMAVAEVTPGIASSFGLSLDDGVAISARVWETEADGRDVYRREIRLGDDEGRVASVAPAWLDGLFVGRPVDVWTPLQEATLHTGDRRSRNFWVLARLKPGVTVDQAQRAVNARRSQNDAIAVLPYRRMTPDVEAGLSRIGALLRAAAAALFFMACGNVASFVLARASARSRDTAVRVALGSSRARLTRQLLSDSLVMSIAGGTLGIVIALWTRDIVPALFFVEDARRLVFAPDVTRILAISAGCIAVTIVCGLVPMFALRDDKPATVLQREAAGDSRRMRLFRDVVLSAQMACCCLLIVTTGLLLDGLRRALETSAGRRLGEAVLVTPRAPVFVSQYETADKGLRYFEQVERAARSIAGAVQTAWVGTPPGSRPQWQSIRIEPPRLPLRDVVVNTELFTAGTLARVKTPPAAGQLFGGFETEACPSVVVDERAAAALFESDPLGRVIDDGSGRRHQIIGVVATREGEKSSSRPPPTIYYDGGQPATVARPAGPARVRVPALPAPLEGVLDTVVVSANYFRMIGVPLRTGRGFAEDAPVGGCRVGVLNEEAATRYFPGGAPGGAVIDPSGRRAEIVGVVRSLPLRSAQRPIEPTLYLPLSHQDFLAQMTLVLDVRDSSPSRLDALRDRVNAVPGGAARVLVTTLDAHLTANALAPERIAAMLVGASAVTALGLGIVGLYGSMADAARRQRRELALRIALGAQGWRIARHVMAKSTWLAGAGAIAGMIASRLVAEWIAGVTASSDVRSTWIWIAVPPILLAAVTLGAVFPVRRATAVDPLMVMRDT